MRTQTKAIHTRKTAAGDRNSSNQATTGLANSGASTITTECTHLSRPQMYTVIKLRKEYHLPSRSYYPVKIRGSFQKTHKNTMFKAKHHKSSIIVPSIPWLRKITRRLFS